MACRRLRRPGRLPLRKSSSMKTMLMRTRRPLKEAVVVMARCLHRHRKPVPYPQGLLHDFLSYPIILAMLNPLRVEYFNRRFPFLHYVSYWTLASFLHYQCHVRIINHPSM